MSEENIRKYLRLYKSPDKIRKENEEAARNKPVEKKLSAAELDLQSRTSVTAYLCYMSGCKNNRLCKNTSSTMQMFLFPTNINLAKFWLGICNRQPYQCPYHGFAVCKDHFRVDNLESGSLSDESGIVLKPNVIPTAKIPNICYSMILEYLKQMKVGNELDPKKIGVDFSCDKKDCTLTPRPPRVQFCYYTKKPGMTPSKTLKGESPSAASRGVSIALK